MAAPCANRQLGECHLRELGASLHPTIGSAARCATLTACTTVAAAAEKFHWLLAAAAGGGIRGYPQLQLHITARGMTQRNLTWAFQHQHKASQSCQPACARQPQSPLHGAERSPLHRGGRQANALTFGVARCCGCTAAQQAGQHAAHTSPPQLSKALAADVLLGLTSPAQPWHSPVSPMLVRKHSRVGSAIMPVLMPARTTQAWIWARVRSYASDTASCVCFVSRGGGGVGGTGGAWQGGQLVGMARASPSPLRGPTQILRPLLPPHRNVTPASRSASDRRLSAPPRPLVCPSTHAYTQVHTQVHTLSPMPFARFSKMPAMKFSVLSRRCTLRAGLFFRVIVASCSVVRGGAGGCRMRGAGYEGGGAESQRAQFEMEPDVQT